MGRRSISVTLHGSRGSAPGRSTETIPSLFLAWFSKALATTISVRPSASTTTQLIILESPAASTCRSHPGFSYQTSSGMPLASAIKSGLPS